MSESSKWSLYDSNSDHIWNRLYRSLYLRVAHGGQEYGYDELDPLLWVETRYLLNGPAYQQAINCLDEFLATHGERLISDPRKQVILLRDLWAVFDWTTQGPYSPSPDKGNLQIKLVQVIRRLALPVEQIRALPNNYRDAVAAKTFATDYDPNRREVPFLPPDLFEPNGPWVQLSAQGGGPSALEHVAAFSQRSVFLIFIRVPAGREATLAYLKKLSDFPQPWILDQQEPRRALPNPELPQFPIGTQLALVRQMMLLDNQANLTPTTITEDVQIRVHRAIPAEIPEGLNIDRNEAATSLDVYEFKLTRAKLFDSVSGGLRSVTRDEKEFPLFQSHGIDPFELPAGHGTHLMRPILNFCSNCHFRPGIHSVLSRSVRRKMIPSWDREYEVNSTKGWKHSQYSWGLLRGVWQLAPVATPISHD